jgi:hypothetical protein
MDGPWAALERHWLAVAVGFAGAMQVGRGFGGVGREWRQGVTLAPAVPLWGCTMWGSRRAVDMRGCPAHTRRSCCESPPVVQSMHGSFARLVSLCGCAMR